MKFTNTPFLQCLIHPSSVSPEHKVDSFCLYQGSKCSSLSYESRGHIDAFFMPSMLVDGGSLSSVSNLGVIFVCVCF